MFKNFSFMMSLILIGLLFSAQSVFAEDCNGKTLQQCFGSDHHGLLTGEVTQRSLVDNSLIETRAISCRAYFGISIWTEQKLSLAPFWLYCDDDPQIMDESISYGIFENKIYHLDSSGNIDHASASIGFVESTDQIKIEISTIKKNVKVYQLQPSTLFYSCYKGGAVTYDLQYKYELEVQNIPGMGLDVKRTLTTEVPAFFMSGIPSDIRTCQKLRSYLSHEKVLKKKTRTLSGRLLFSN